MAQNGWENYSEAYDYLDKQLKITSANDSSTISILYFVKSVYERSQANHNSILSNLTKAINYDSTFSHAYFHRGDLYRAYGKFDSAISDYQYAIESFLLNDEYVTWFGVAMKNMGYCHMRLSLSDTKMAPKLVKFHLIRAWSLSALAAVQLPNDHEILGHRLTIKLMLLKHGIPLDSVIEPFPERRGMKPRSR